MLSPLRALLSALPACFVFAATLVAPAWAVVGVNEKTGLFYLTSQNRQSTAIIDPRLHQVVLRLPFGRSVTHITANPETNRVYFTFPNHLAVLDGSSNAVIDRVWFGPGASILETVVDPAANRIYVTASSSSSDIDRIAVVDGVSDTVVNSIEFPGTFVSSLGVDHARDRLYAITAEGQKSVLHALSLGNGTEVANLRLPDNTARLFVFPSVGLIYAWAINGAVAAVVDEESLTRKPDVSLPGFVGAQNTRLNTLYLVGQGPGRKSRVLTYLDASNGTITRQLTLSTRRHCCSLVTDSRRGGVYVADRFTLRFLLDAELLANPSFEDSFPQRADHAWRGAHWLIPFTQDVDGKRGFQIDGALGERTALVQAVDTVGASGTVFHLEGWSRSTGAAATGGEYGLEATLNFTDGTHRTWHLPFDKTAHDWEKVSKRIVAPQDFDHLVVRVVYENQEGVAAFDDLHAWREDAPNAPIQPLQSAKGLSTPTAQRNP